MDKAYAWHPGADGVAPQWGVPVALMPDELFSGWLIRVAFTQGCSLSALMASIEPGLRFHDVDRGLSEHQLVTLSLHAGVSVAAIQAAMLAWSESAINGGICRRRSIWRWILPLGLQVTRRHQGLQYCPVCWGEDASPYVRLQWRFAWHIACDAHGVTLRDRCFQCQAPLRLHRHQCMNHCGVCGADLRAAPQILANVDALHLQRAADHVLRERVGEVWSVSLGVVDWFHLMALLISFLRREALREPARLSMFACELDLIRRLEKSRLELLRVEERQVMLALIYRVFALRRAAVIRLVSDGGWSRQALVAHVDQLSSLLQQGWQLFPDKSVSRHPRGPYAPRSRRLVKAMMARLRRDLRELV